MEDKQEIMDSLIINNITPQLTDNIILTEEGFYYEGQPIIGVGTWDKICRKAFLLQDLTTDLIIETDKTKPVLINGGGHSIDHLGGYGVFIPEGMQNIVIRNLTVKNTTYGVYVSAGVQNIKICGNCFDNNQYGVYFSGSNSAFSVLNEVTNNNIFSRISDGVGIYFDGSGFNSLIVTDNNIIQSGNTSRGIVISSFLATNINIFNNCIDFKGIDNYIIGNDVSIDLKGIQLVQVNQSKINKNKISFSKNSFNVSKNHSYIYFHGIHSSSGKNNCIDENCITVDENIISIDNTERPREQQTVFYGITLEDNNLDSDIKGNRISIKANAVLTSTLPIAYSSNKFRGIFLGDNNNSIDTCNNEVVINKNTFTINSGNNDGNYVEDFLEGIYFRGRNSSNTVKNTMIKIYKNNISVAQIKTVNNNFVGVHLSAENNSNIIEGNNIELSCNSKIYVIGPGSAEIDKNKLVGIHINEGNTNCEILKNCIVVEKNEVDQINDSMERINTSLIHLLELNYNTTIAENWLNGSQGDGIRFSFDGNSGAYICKNSIINSNGYGIFISESNNNCIRIVNNDIIYSEIVGLFINDNVNSVIGNNFINKQSKNVINIQTGVAASYFDSNYYSDWDGYSIPYEVNNVVDFHPLIEPIKLCLNPKCVEVSKAVDCNECECEAHNLDSNKECQCTGEKIHPNDLANQRHKQREFCPKSNK